MADYAEEAAYYRRLFETHCQRPPRTLLDLLEERDARTPQQAAFVWEDQPFSFEWLWSGANRFGAFLLDLGVARGDRVFLFLDNTPEAVVAFWATLKADAVVSVINPQTKAVLANIRFATPLAFGVNISDDDSRAYVACANELGERGRVYIINTQNFQKVDSLLVGKNPYMAHFHGPHH